MDWLWIPFGVAAAVAFFKIIEGWSELGDRLPDDHIEEHDEWPT